MTIQPVLCHLTKRGAAGFARAFPMGLKTSLIGGILCKACLNRRPSPSLCPPPGWQVIQALWLGSGTPDATPYCYTDKVT